MTFTARVGMVGAGQLARMTHRAAIDLGIELVVLAVGDDDPAVRAGARYVLGAPDDLDAMRRLATRVDVVTLDHELVPGEHLRTLSDEGHLVRPGADALMFAQDKLHARTRLSARGVPVPAFAAVETEADVTTFGEEHGWPVVLKATRGGYDGRGVEVVGDAREAAAVLDRGGAWLAEEHVELACELAVLTARSASGEQRTHDVVRTVQDEGICVEVAVPAEVDPGLRGRAVDMAESLARDVDAVGVMAVELFVTTDGTLLLNELALRPHNSGHVTIESAATSQFAQHLRAVLGWPLGPTALRAPAAVTLNVLGSDHADDHGATLPEALAVEGAHVHLYGKSWRPGRKLGHVTALADDVEAARTTDRAAVAALAGR